MLQGLTLSDTKTRTNSISCLEFVTNVTIVGNINIKTQAICKQHLFAAVNALHKRIVLIHG